VKNYKQYPTDLTDEQWNYIKEMIPAAKQGGRPRTLDMRMVVNAILYVVVGGIQWRMLPKEYPNWKSTYHYFRIWRDANIWKRIHNSLRALLRRRINRHKHPTAGSIDSQSVKTSEWAKERGFDAGKNIKGRKRHILVDTQGLIFAIKITIASVQDRDAAKSLFKNLDGSCKKLRLIWVDGGYRGKLIDWVKSKFKFHLSPILRDKNQDGFVVLPRRWVVERTFAWLGHSRRLTKDYEGLASSSEAMIYIAMIRIMLKRLA